MLVTSYNETSRLKRLADDTMKAIRSSADTVENADVIVDALWERVTSSMTSLMTSQHRRDDVNKTLDEYEPVDISEDLMTIGTTCLLFLFCVLTCLGYLFIYGISVDQEG